MSRPRRWGKEGVLPRKGVTDLTRPPPSSGHPHASALSVSLLSAWIVAQLRRGNFKRLQGQDRQSVMPEKLVGGMEGRPGAGQGVAGEECGCREERQGTALLVLLLPVEGDSGDRKYRWSASQRGLVVEPQWECGPGEPQGPSHGHP